jgi:hypothetical protein
MPGPFNFEYQKITARNLVLSANKQTAYNTAIAGASMTRRQKFDGSAVGELKTTRFSDKAMAGKGTEFATQGLITGWDSAFSFKADADDWLIGWALAFAMGKDVTTGAGPYLHTITFDETTVQAPAASIYLQDTAAVFWTLVDMGLADLTITIPARGPIQLELSFVGTGISVDGVIAALPALPTSYAYMLGSDVVFSIGNHGAVVSKIGRFMTGTIKISTGVESHKAPGVGLYGVFPKTGLRKVSFSATIAAKDTEDIRPIFNTNETQEVSFVGTSGTSIMNLDFPFCSLKTTKLGASGNSVVWQIEADETTIYNQGGAGVMTAAITNSQTTAYLVGA